MSEVIPPAVRCAANSGQSSAKSATRLCLSSGVVRISRQGLSDSER